MILRKKACTYGMASLLWFSKLHVTLPYALTVAGVSFVCYLIAGLVRNAWVMLPLSILLMVGTLLVIRAVVRSKENV